MALPDDSAFTDLPGARVVYLDYGFVGNVVSEPANRLDAIGYCAIPGTTVPSVLADVTRMARRVPELVRCSPT
ncbi:MAG TPA: hypothetical protein VFQ44_12070 [Streptosporangiaceae bacterium]|nr:hypothetical protein [Streptosporangiaceae bacterium]